MEIIPKYVNPECVVPPHFDGSSSAHEVSCIEDSFVDSTHPITPVRVVFRTLYSRPASLALHRELAQDCVHQNSLYSVYAYRERGVALTGEDYSLLAALDREVAWLEELAVVAAATNGLKDLDPSEREALKQLLSSRFFTTAASLLLSSNAANDLLEMLNHSDSASDYSEAAVHSLGRFVQSAHRLQDTEPPIVFSHLLRFGQVQHVVWSDVKLKLGDTLHQLSLDVAGNIDPILYDILHGFEHVVSEIHHWDDLIHCTENSRQLELGYLRFFMKRTGFFSSSAVRIFACIVDAFRNCVHTSDSARAILGSALETVEHLSREWTEAVATGKNTTYPPSRLSTTVRIVQRVCSSAPSHALLLLDQRFEEALHASRLEMPRWPQISLTDSLKSLIDSWLSSAAATIDEKGQFRLETCNNLIYWYLGKASIPVRRSDTANIDAWLAESLLELAQRRMQATSVEGTLSDVLLLLSASHPTLRDSRAILERVARAGHWHTGIGSESLIAALVALAVIADSTHEVTSKWVEFFSASESTSSALVARVRQASGDPGLVLSDASATTHSEDVASAAMLFACVAIARQSWKDVFEWILPFVSELTALRGTQNTKIVRAALLSTTLPEGGVDRYWHFVRAICRAGLCSPVAETVAELLGATSQEWDEDADRALRHVQETYRSALSSSGQVLEPWDIDEPLDIWRVYKLNAWQDPAPKDEIVVTFYDTSELRFASEGPIAEVLLRSAPETLSS
jgi:hypothetical protein